ncbi:tRNA (guanine-N(7)-)-methyltransferase non-catalytic subunit trm82 [Coemansia sp. BCRC 34301]|nr:tRNA (guanine-N(7)-)-methyltransferase non-catalytic subunit trm82 [Coemansia sp. BCRC 34301]
MPRLHISLVETSPKGAVALVFGADFHITDASGKIRASTTADDGACEQMVKIERPSKGDIRAATFSRDGALFAICTADKGLYIYETEHWATVRSMATEKRTNALAFDPSSAFLVTADKFGDAHLVATSHTDEKPKLLLGHVSILYAIAFTFSDKPLVLTCDRDEKLRVSKYPNAYNIQSFGLGHTEFVTTVAAARFAPDSAVTGSGDGTLRLWGTSSGDLVQTVELSKHLAKYYESGAAIRGTNTFDDRTAAADRYGVLRVRAIDAVEAFVAVVERIPAVIVFPFSQGKLAEPQVIDIALPPTDVAVLGDRLVVSYAPVADGELVSALKHDGSGFVTDDELTAALSANVATKETETVPQVKSIFVWGNKMYLQRPKDEEDDDEQE